MGFMGESPQNVKEELEGRWDDHRYWARAGNLPISACDSCRGSWQLKPLLRTCGSVKVTKNPSILEGKSTQKAEDGIRDQHQLTPKIPSIT